LLCSVVFLFDFICFLPWSAALLLYFKWFYCGLQLSCCVMQTSC
jgi:hypothetical protein